MSNDRLYPSNTVYVPESLDEFIENELSSNRICISVKIQCASDVNRSELLKEICKLQEKPEDYYKNKNEDKVYHFTWWINDIYYSVKSHYLDEKILKMLTESRELVDEIEKRYPDCGVFHRKNSHGFPVGHGDYFDCAMKDDQRLEWLQNSCLKKIAKEFYETYGTEDIIEEEMYKRGLSHTTLRNSIVKSLNEHLTTFARESEDCEYLIKKMIDIQAEYYKRRPLRKIW